MCYPTGLVTWRNYLYFEPDTPPPPHPELKFCEKGKGFHFTLSLTFAVFTFSWVKLVINILIVIYSTANDYDTALISKFVKFRVIDHYYSDKENYTVWVWLTWCQWASGFWLKTCDQRYQFSACLGWLTGGMFFFVFVFVFCSIPASATVKNIYVNYYNT